MKYPHYRKKANKKDLVRIEEKFRGFFFEFGTLRFNSIDEIVMMLEEEVPSVVEDVLKKLEQKNRLYISKQIIWEPRPPHQQLWIDYIPF